MLGLKVTINDGESVTGGTEDLGVLTASVSASGILGKESDHPRPGEPPDIWIRLGGLTSRVDAETDEHLCWMWSELNVGDRIVVEVVEIDSSDEPTERMPKRDRANQPLQLTSDARE